MNRNFALILLFSPLLALAQTAAPLSAEAAPAPNTCVRPNLDVKIGKKEEGDAFNAKNAAYRDCIQAYVGVQKAAADLHSQAANAAVQDFNSFSVELNEKFGKAKPKE